MKKIIKFAAVAAVAATLFGFLAVKATTYTLVGSMVTVDNTTSNTAAITLGTFAYPRGTFYIQNGGLTATGALVINIQASVDDTNFITIATYRPAATNATTETYSPAYAAQTIYLRASVVTTNSVQVGGVYQSW